MKGRIRTTSKDQDKEENTVDKKAFMKSRQQDGKWMKDNDGKIEKIIYKGIKKENAINSYKCHFLSRL